MTQPKPATGEYKVIGCNDPADKHLVGKTLHSDNPTTDCYAKATQSKGEWTHSWLGQPVDPSPLTEAIAHHHNAALASEREERDIVARSRNVWQLQVAEHGKTIQQLREQLAVAVEALKQVNELLDEYSESEKPAVDTLSKIEEITFPALARI